MADGDTRRELDRLLDQVDAPRALVILVDENGQIETAEKNLGMQNTMLVCFSLAVQIAQELQGTDKVARAVARRNPASLLALPEYRVQRGGRYRP